MENLIDESYFWGELAIGGLNNNSSGTLLGEAGSNTSNELAMFISKYQNVYLTQMFGKDIAKADSLPAELKALIVNDTTKVSPIANCVYFFYLRAKESVHTASGTKVLTPQNVVFGNAFDKMKNAWNEMAMESLKIHEDLYNGDETLADIDYINEIYPNIDFSNDIFNTIGII